MADGERLSLTKNTGNGNFNDIEIEDKKKSSSTSCFVYVLTILSALGGFLFGYDTGVVSGSMLLVRKYFHLDNLWHELIVSATIASAWLFSLVAGKTSDSFGRKTTILMASFVFTVGAVLMGAAMDKYVLLTGRIVAGVGIGMISSTVPMYIAEASPYYSRGRLVTFHILMVTGGQVIGTMMAGAFSNDHITGWRYMLGLSGIPAIIQFIGFLGMPESPRWLMKKGKADQAFAVLQSIRKGHTIAEINKEMNSIRETCDEESSGQSRNKVNSSVLITIFKTPTVRRALILGCGLQMFQQLAGINTVMYYSAPIIKMAGVTDDSEAIWLAAAVAGINFFGTFIGLYLVEKIGRRPLILVSLLGVIFSLLLLAIGFELSDITSPKVTFWEKGPSKDLYCNEFKNCGGCTNDPKCGFCYWDSPTTVGANGSCVALNSDTKLPDYGRCTSNATNMIWADDWCPSSYIWITLSALCLYLLFFAPGMGPMPWTINSEIFPLWARGTAYSITTSTNWASNLAVSMTFLTLTEVLTKQGTFYLYTALATIGLIYFYYALPETKGLTLEEVEGLFTTGFQCCKPPESGAKIVRYVHIKGVSTRYRDSNDSGDEDYP